MRSNYINCKQLLLLGVSLRCAAGRALVLRIELRLRGCRPLRASIPDASVTARRHCAPPLAGAAPCRLLPALAFSHINFRPRRAKLHVHMNSTTTLPNRSCESW